MSETDQISGLEAALVDRASKLAAEYVANGRQEYDRLLAEAKQRLHDDEERAVAAAKSRAERAYQQQVQAAELHLRAELDRLRLELVNVVLERLPGQLEQLAADEARYLPLLRKWLHDGAQAIEHGELVVQFNARDLQRLKPGWDRWAREAAPGKRLVLGSEGIAAAGGVLITSEDRNIRVDNTFEGRQERLGDRLQNAVAEQLVPAASAGGGD